MYWLYGALQRHLRFDTTQYASWGWKSMILGTRQFWSNDCYITFGYLFELRPTLWNGESWASFKLRDFDQSPSFSRGQPFGPELSISCFNESLELVYYKIIKAELGNKHWRNIEGFKNYGMGAYAHDGVWRRLFLYISMSLWDLDSNDNDGGQTESLILSNLKDNIQQRPHLSSSSEPC